VRGDFRTDPPPPPLGRPAAGPQLTQQQESDDAGQRHGAPGAGGPQREGQQREPDHEEARGVAGVVERDGRAQDALAAAQAVLKVGEVVLHAQRGHHRQLRRPDDLCQHLRQGKGVGGISNEVGWFQPSASTTGSYAADRRVWPSTGSSGGGPGPAGMALSADSLPFGIQQSTAELDRNIPFSSFPCKDIRLFGDPSLVGNTKVAGCPVPSRQEAKRQDAAHPFPRVGSLVSHLQDVVGAVGRLHHTLNLVREQDALHTQPEQLNAAAF
jgi:hypothetical protein